MTPDIARIKQMLLDEFYEPGTTQAEMEAFLTGMTWLEEELVKKEQCPESLNAYVPEMKIMEYRLKEWKKAVDDLMKENEKDRVENVKLTKKVTGLQAILDNQKVLSKRELAEIRMNEEYKRMQFLVHSMELDRDHYLNIIINLRKEIKRLKGQGEGQ